LQKDSGAVPRVFFATAGAAMGKVFQHPNAVANDPVRLPSFDVDDKSDAARIAFIPWIVEAFRLGWRELPPQRFSMVHVAHFDARSGGVDSCFYILGVNPSVRVYRRQSGARQRRPEFPDWKSFGNTIETTPQLRTCYETCIVAEKLK
jgi:hypothetical protein